MKFSLLRFSAFVVVMVVLVKLSGCKTAGSDKDLDPISVADAQQAINGKRSLLGLGAKEKAVWVDARSEADYRAGHIPGAISLPFERVSLDHKMLNDYDVIIVYGNDYEDSRAKGMSKRLMELDHSNVRTLTGGMRAWKTEGNPVETSQ